MVRLKEIHTCTHRYTHSRGQSKKKKQILWLLCWVNVIDRENKGVAPTQSDPGGKFRVIGILYRVPEISVNTFHRALGEIKENWAFQPFKMT